MLENIDGKKAKKEGRHSAESQRRRARLSPEEFTAIVDALTAVLDTTPVGQPIYSKACEGDFVASALFLGNLMRSVVIDHPCLWRSVKQPKSKYDSGGAQTTLYWRAS